MSAMLSYPGSGRLGCGCANSEAAPTNETHISNLWHNLPLSYLMSRKSGFYSLHFEKKIGKKIYVQISSPPNFPQLTPWFFLVNKIHLQMLLTLEVMKLAPRLCTHMGVEPKIGGKPTKMDGENSGKPY